ncbi:LIM domain-containing protein unc-97 [Toxocara canis]|uniref:LIM domain-containing protein unc-97 n=1 Tax=Toxocara canis TaxID=6265 RepID=A0A0B2VW17_TOXCA|nr:LIM domain-containing protein unc-97 [Toxocara canis]
MERPLRLSVSGTSPSLSPISASSYSASYASVPIDPLSPLSVARCARCQQLFASGEVFVSTGNKTWHNDCFRCAQCFCSLVDSIHFLVDGRNYCEYDFKALYAPSCAKCKEFIMGRVIKAANSSWHPQCLRCEQCNKQLDTEGVWHHAGRNLCMVCNKLAKKEGGKMCSKCKTYIEPDKQLRYQHEDFHAYHFNCKKCSAELNEKARIYKKELYCPRCYDQLCHVCAACRHPIDEERSVFALEKHWHLDHFLCAKCEKPFYGSKYYERRERAYCECCYKKVFADECFKCSAGLTGGSLKVFAKFWCPKCYACSTCDRPLDQRSKVIEMDMRPVCKKCFEKFPKELKQRMMRM